VIRELLETEPKQGAVWNVNFPPMRTRSLMGILRDRTVATVSMFTERYVETLQPDGSKVLTIQGIPTPDSELSEGSDAEAVRKGYISIGKVSAF
jgi:broad specificity polyphosphatase/5'/3'-nucleotidase SurE